MKLNEAFKDWWKRYRPEPTIDPRTQAAKDAWVAGIRWYRNHKPQISESEIISIAYDCDALPEVITDKTLIVFVRAIEQRMRGI